MGRGRGEAGGGRRGLLPFLVLLAAGWWFLAPPLLGGSMSYVVTTQQASTAEVEPGGLLLVRQRGEPQVGEVVAHRNGPDGTVGVGRIATTDGDRFVVHRGDRGAAAAYRPTGEELLGSEWLYIPYVASLATGTVTLVGVGLGLVVLVLLLGGGHQRAGLTPVRRPATRLQS